MRDGQPPEGWKQTWPEILRVEKAGAHPRVTGDRRPIAESEPGGD
jgi:hypothetical protein